MGSTHDGITIRNFSEARDPKETGRQAGRQAGRQQEKLFDDYWAADERLSRS
jgi:hypothetical protein